MVSGIRAASVASCSAARCTEAISQGLPTKTTGSSCAAIRHKASPGLACAERAPAARRVKRNVKATLFRAVRFYEPRELRSALRPYASGPIYLASTLHFFPFHRPGLEGALASWDRRLTRRGWLLGAFLVASVGVQPKEI